MRARMRAGRARWARRARKHRVSGVVHGHTWWWMSLWVNRTWSRSSGGISTVHRAWCHGGRSVKRYKGCAVIWRAGILGIVCGMLSDLCPSWEWSSLGWRCWNYWRCRCCGCSCPRLGKRGYKWSDGRAGHFIDWWTWADATRKDLPSKKRSCFFLTQTSESRTAFARWYM
jgi:hypothetical protein